MKLATILVDSSKNQLPKLAEMDIIEIYQIYIYIISYTNSMFDRR